MSKYYYNDVLLPEIPQEVLSQYPYCWIRNNTSSGNYDLILSNVKWFLDSSGKMNFDSDNTKRGEWYTIPIESSENTNEWVFNQDIQGGNFNINTSQTVLWSNHDISNGSATSTTIYFYGSKPVPEDGLSGSDEPEVSDKFYGIESLGTLSTLTTSREGGYTFNVNKKCNLTGFRLYTASSLTNIKCTLWDSSQKIITSGIIKTVSKDNWSEVYLDTAITLEAGKQYTVSCWINATRYRSTISDMTFSSYISIVNGCYISSQGSYPSTISTTYVYQVVDLILSEPFDIKYLIRSENNIYTIIDGNLSALEETFIDSSLFKNSGFDTPPVWDSISNLVNPEILCWYDTYDEVPKLNATMSATPLSSQNVITNAIDSTDPTITGIELMTVNCEGNPLFAVSFDGKATWYAWNGTEWSLVSEEYSGMTKELLESVTYDQWMLLYEGASNFYIRATITTLEDKLTEVYVDFAN